MTTKEQLIKEFREKFKCIQTDCNGNGHIPELVSEENDEWTSYQCEFHAKYLFPLEVFLLSAFDAGRASGIEEVNKKIKDKKEMYEPAYEPEDQAIVSVLSELLTPSSSKDN